MRDFIKTVLYGIPVAIIIFGLATVIVMYKEVTTFIVAGAVVTFVVYVVGMITRGILKERKERRNE